MNYQLWKSIQPETIYIGECEHITCFDIKSDECLKRYFDIFLPEEGRDVRVAICSDNVRLLYHRFMNEGGNKWIYRDGRERDVPKQIICDMICKHFNIKDKTSDHGWFRINKKICINDIPVYISMSEKLGLYMKFNLQELISTYLNSPSSEIYLEIKRVIKEYVDSNYHYISHTNFVKKLRPLINKINGCYNNSESMIILNEISLMLLQLDTIKQTTKTK